MHAAVEEDDDQRHRDDLLHGDNRHPAEGGGQVGGDGRGDQEDGRSRQPQDRADPVAEDSGTQDDADGADHQAEAVGLLHQSRRFCSRTWPAGDQPSLLVVDLDQPQLLQPAAVDRRTGRDQLALADGPQEVGVVRDADHLAVIAQPECARDAGDGLDDGAVDAAVSDAVGLPLGRRDRPAHPQLLGIRGLDAQAERCGEALAQQLFSGLERDLSGHRQSLGHQVSVGSSATSPRSARVGSMARAWPAATAPRSTRQPVGVVSETVRAKEPAAPATAGSPAAWSGFRAIAGAARR